MSSLALQSSLSPHEVEDSEDFCAKESTDDMAFLEFLGVPLDRLPSKDSKAKKEFTSKAFVDAANVMAQSMRDLWFANKDMLVFKTTGEKHHAGHIKYVECKPDFTVAFRRNWNDNGTTLWPCIRLAGASEGKSLNAQREQAYWTLHYLLLARPDLHVAQGIIASEGKVRFLFGIGGFGIRSFVFKWGIKDLHRLMYAFVYRLYDPGHFADSSYVGMVPNLESGQAAYTVRVTEANGVTRTEKTITGLLLIHASSPFGTRTHILSNPASEVSVNGKHLTVLKDQLCRIGTQFDECRILSQIHSLEEVPGVVEAIYKEEIKIPRSICEFRIKRRMGMWQLGTSFMSIPTLQQTLEIVFDTLEVLRYLRVKHSILHRDISRGNVLYLKDNCPFSSGTVSGTESGEANETVEPKEVPLCFIKYLLDEGNDPRETSVLLIDFDHAKIYKSDEDPASEQPTRTGTPVFIARSVELGCAVPLPRYGDGISPVPESPEPYSRYHPDRIKKFPLLPRERKEPPPTDSTKPKWRHELDHDTESVFWLLLYWVVCAQPTESGKESIDYCTWDALMGSADDRNRLLQGQV
ncbi:hypothetical protein BC826DRAFT_1009694 [Russula brevipes]|nr:hypothetical protein BC826DRAFT_1009694 [Russula brevipes]